MTLKELNELFENKNLETKLAEAQAEIEKATATEAERWAERLNWLHTKYGADCSGTDSADLLDCVEDEIKQVINSQSELIEQMRDALIQAKDNFETMDKIMSTRCAPIRIARAAYNTGLSYLDDAIEAALAAERGE